MTPTHTQKQFNVLLTADFYGADGNPKFADIGLAEFDGHAHVKTGILEPQLPEIDPGQVGDAQGIIALTPSVTARSLSQAGNLLAIAGLALVMTTSTSTRVPKRMSR